MYSSDVIHETIVDLLGVLELPSLFVEGILDVLLYPLDVGHIFVQFILHAMHLFMFPLLVVVPFRNAFELRVYFMHVAISSVKIEKSLLPGETHQIKLI